MPKVDGLTDKRRRFVEEYVVDFNATQAAIRAGYSAKTAQPISGELLSIPIIQKAVKAELDRLGEETGVTAERAIEETGRLAFAQMTSYLDFGPDGVLLKDIKDMTEEEIAAISEVSETVTKEGGSLRFKLHSKTTALDQLHRIFGSYKDSLEHKGAVAIEIKEVALVYEGEGE